VDWEPGFVRARLKYADRLSAHDGVFHGGVLATVSMTVQYIGVAPGEPELLVEGTCVKRGRRLNFTRSQVLTEGGRVLAEVVLTISASGERPRLGTLEDAPPS
jgi:acyl-coenzyme A thioesterase PaaI-like protein